MKLLNKYFKIIHQIYDYFDYSGSEKIYPIEDYTEFDWILKDNKILYSSEDDEYIEDEYIDVYNGEEYTMFLIKDSLNVDDCLIIFDNKKKLNKNDYRY